MVSAILIIVCIKPAIANNGLNLIGFGTESVTMGGADLAVARDTSAINTNPAGLMQIAASQLDIHSAIAAIGFFAIGFCFSEVTLAG